MTGKAYADKDTSNLSDRARGTALEPTSAEPHEAQMGDSAPKAAKSIVQLIDAVATMPNVRGREYIEKTREGAPFRRPRRSRFNGTAHLASLKTGIAQQFESHNIELPIGYECESSDLVSDYWAQAKPLELRYASATGRTVCVSHTPDCLVVLKDKRVALLEGKSRDKFIKELALGNPRFAIQDGFFCDPIAKSRCKEMGIAHLVITENEVNPTLFANYYFLGTSYAAKWSPSQTTKHLLEYINGIGVSDLENLIFYPQGWTADDVYGSIVKKLTYFSLETTLLFGVGISNAYVYATKDHLEIAESIPRVAGASPIASFSEIYQKCSDKQLEQLCHRWEAIKPVVQGIKTRKSLTRTERGWLDQYRESTSIGNAGMDVLIPKFSRRGNRNSRLNDQVEKIIEEEIDAILNPSKSGGKRCFGNVLRRCDEINETGPSKATFYIRLNKKKAERIKQIDGSDQAYQHEPAKQHSLSVLARMSERAWQSETLDHTPIPLKTVTTALHATIPGQLYLSYMRLGGTDKIVGRYLSFRRPTYITIQSLLLDCVARHGRPPESLRLDGEKPHDAVPTEKLLARIEATKLARRYKKPRDENSIERGFWDFEQGLFQHLNGNYVHRKDPKDWTTEISPINRAEWTIGGVFLAVDKYIEDYFNSGSKRARLDGLTPNEATQLSLKIHGSRDFSIPIDRDAIPRVMWPTTKKTTHTFNISKGLVANGIRYVPIKPIHPSLSGKSFLVRFNPYDLRYVIAEIEGRWVWFVHPNVERYKSLTPTLLAAISIEAIHLSYLIEKSSGEQAKLLSTCLQKVNGLPRDPLGEFLDAERDTSSPEPAQDSIWNRISNSTVNANGTRARDGAE